MKTVVMYTTLVVMYLCAQILSAQEVSNSSIAQLEEQKEEIILSEKEGLKKEVEAINERLANDEITAVDAKQLKEKVAEKYALNIENRLAIVDNQIALLQRNDIEYVNLNQGKISIGIGSLDEDNGDIIVGMKLNTGKDKKIVYDQRTTSHLTLAFGLNNTIGDDRSLDNSDYKIAGSRFFEIGWTWQTRVFKNSNFMRMKYGISYQSNGLKPTDNRFFVQSGDQTELEEFAIDLDKSKFRMDNLVIPVHFEFGPSKVEETDKKIRYRTTGKFKIGLGGYAGLNINTVQKLKYKEEGSRVKDKIKSDYNTSDLVYGLSGYLGFGDASLYIKYDLSPVFQNAPIDQNNISLGVRFDL
ncbi:hypothetical protein GCM10022393_28560 [Aquimarina addita]|uniref:Outer membrane protein beta-barrel domain-containing protein n=1 Tax=Aquimarina addita TaxID=870485 RepID=A0ABP6UMJ4_9FLAO